MIFVGERINTGFKEIRQAVTVKDAGPLQSWARRQKKAGANFLDVNLGAVSTKTEDMCWMIETVQQAVDTPISVDCNKVDMITESLKVCKGPVLINSTTAADERMGQILPIVAKHNASVIALVMDENGSPKNVDKRVENAGKIVAAAMDLGIPMDHLFIDPIAMPLKFMQDQEKEILEAIRQFQLFADPPPHVICGLSNVSNGCIHKKLINRTFLTMAIAAGLDSVICDVTDVDLMNAAHTAELVMNREIYADAYIKVPQEP